MPSTSNEFSNSRNYTERAGVLRDSRSFFIQVDRLFPACRYFSDVWQSDFTGFLRTDPNSMNQRVAAAIDIGGTNTAIGLVTAEGRLLAKTSILTTDHPTPERLVEGVAASIQGLLKQTPGTVPVHIGIGRPTEITLKVRSSLPRTSSGRELFHWQVCSRIE